MEALRRQFACPAGWLGRIAGWLMAWGNRDLNSWAVDLLDLGPADRVLDVGCGPGAGLDLAQRKVVRGLVTGIDASPVMVGQAARRNRLPLREGRLRLVQGEASRLPCADASFDKAFAVNSVQFWPDPAVGLREIRRVLRPHGLLVVVVQPRGLRTQAEVEEVRRRLLHQLTEATFKVVGSELRALRPVTRFAIVATT